MLNSSQNGNTRRGVIFDVDGTLVDSVDVHARAWQDAFREFGRDIDFAAIRKQIGKGGDQLMPMFLDQKEMETLAGPLEGRRAEILKQNYLSSIKGFPGVRELMQKLLAVGVRIALASSAKKDELQVYKRAAGIEDLIPAETSSDDAEKSKPYPDIFQAAIPKLGGVAPENILVVGDTPYDAQAAGKAGLRSVGVLCGGFSEQELREAGCVAIYRDPADLLSNYDRLPFGGEVFSGGQAMTDVQPTTGGAEAPSASTASVAEQARQAGAAAADHARDVASEARTRAASLGDTLKQQAASLGESQKDKAADALESVAKAIHQTGTRLEGDQDWAARLVEKGAAELDSLATALRRNDVQGLIDNLGSLARRQPAVFVGASMAAGFLLTRVGRLAAESAPSAEASPSKSTPVSATVTTPAPATTPVPVNTPAMPSTFPEARNGQF